MHAPSLPHRVTVFRRHDANGAPAVCPNHRNIVRPLRSLLSPQRPQSDQRGRVQESLENLGLHPVMRPSGVHFLPATRVVAASTVGRAQFWVRAHRHSLCPLTLHYAGQLLSPTAMFIMQRS